MSSHSVDADPGVGAVAADGVAAQSIQPLSSHAVDADPGVGAGAADGGAVATQRKTIQIGSVQLNSR